MQSKEFLHQVNVRASLRAKRATWTSYSKLAAAFGDKKKNTVSKLTIIVIRGDSYDIKTHSKFVPINDLCVFFLFQKGKYQLRAKLSFKMVKTKTSVGSVKIQNLIQKNSTDTMTYKIWKNNIIKQEMQYTEIKQIYKEKKKHSS